MNTRKDFFVQISKFFGLIFHSVFWPALLIRCDKMRVSGGVALKLNRLENFPGEPSRCIYSEVAWADPISDRSAM